MTDKVYSFDQDLFNDFSREEAAENAVEHAYYNLGDEELAGKTVTIWEGDKHPYPISTFVPDIVEAMYECSYDIAPDGCDNFPDCTVAQAEELQQEVLRTIEEWATKHNLSPSFYAVENVREITLAIMSVDPLEFQEIDQ